jgi:hypothetical protein
MTLPARFSLLHSDLNDFLFAAVGDEANGMPLNVVSALTRLGVDPWQEATRLSALPKAAAVAALAPMIARLPICRPQRLDDWSISHRLVELLPRHSEAVRSSPAREAAKDKRRLHAAMIVVCLILAASVLAAFW